MSEKLASAEIDGNRERFEKWHRRENICDDVELGLEIWQAAERDTRERCAQQVKRWASDLFTQSERSSFGTDELAEPHSRGKPMNPSERSGKE